MTKTVRQNVHESSKETIACDRNFILYDVYRTSVNEVAPPPTIRGGVHLRDAVRKFMYSDNMLRLHLWVDLTTKFFTPV